MPRPVPQPQAAQSAGGLLPAAAPRGELADRVRARRAEMIAQRKEPGSGAQVATGPWKIEPGAGVSPALVPGGDAPRGWAARSMGSGGVIHRQSTGGSGWTTSTINIADTDRFVELPASAGAAVAESPGAMQFSAMAGAASVSRVSPSLGPSVLALVKQEPGGSVVVAASAQAVTTEPAQLTTTGGGLKVAVPEVQQGEAAALVEQLQALLDEKVGVKLGPRDSAYKQKRAAALKLAVVIAAELAHQGVCSSQTLPLSTMERAEAVVTRIMNKGGEGAAAASTAARLFLQDVRDVQRSRGAAASGASLFPMGTEDVAAFVKIFTDEVPRVAAKTQRIKTAVKLLSEVGCRVEVVMETLATATLCQRSCKKRQ